MGKPNQVFVSHSALDREFVEREIVSLLTLHDIRVWYSQQDIQTAAQWHLSILKGLEKCDWFLVVLSPRSVASSWVAAEVHWALEERQGRVVPVLVEDCDWQRLHLMLRTIQHVDLRGNSEDAKRRLLQTWAIYAETGSKNAVVARWPPTRKLLLLAFAIAFLFAAGAILWSSMTPTADAPRSSTEGPYADPPRPPTPSVLFDNLSATDLHRLAGATENDVIRLAQECESEQVRQFAQILEPRPAAMLTLVRLIVDSNSRPQVATITLSSIDAQRLAGATGNDVVRLAAECENEAIRTLAEAFEDQPTVLLELIEEISRWHESRSP